MPSPWNYPGMRLLVWLHARVVGWAEEWQARREPAPPRYIASECPDCVLCRLAGQGPSSGSSSSG